MFIENNESEILTTEQLCERLVISETTAYKLLRAGEIKAFQIGNHWKIPESSIAEYIKQQCNSRITNNK